jgi:hypothetical protein
MLQFEQWENVRFCQKLGKPASKTFQMIKQAYGKETLGRSALFMWQKRFMQGETVWKMMSIPVGQEQSELKSRPKKLHITLVLANCSRW